MSVWWCCWTGECLPSDTDPSCWAVFRPPTEWWDRGGRSASGSRTFSPVTGSEPVYERGASVEDHRSGPELPRACGGTGQPDAGATDSVFQTADVTDRRRRRYRTPFGL